jgi:hypothetical protein
MDFGTFEIKKKKIEKLVSNGHWDILGYNREASLGWTLGHLG